MLYAHMRPHLFFVVLYLVTMALVAHVTTRTQGPHEGILKRSGPYFIEMKEEGTKIYVYLLDKKLVAVNNKDVIGEVSVGFPDNTTQVIPLKPEKEDQFVCEVPQNFSACKITFTVSGKNISARFTSPVKMVHK